MSGGMRGKPNHGVRAFDYCGSFNTRGNVLEIEANLVRSPSAIDIFIWRSLCLREGSGRCALGPAPAAGYICASSLRRVPSPRNASERPTDHRDRPDQPDRRRRRRQPRADPPLPRAARPPPAPIWWCSRSWWWSAIRPRTWCSSRALQDAARDAVADARRRHRRWRPGGDPRRALARRTASSTTPCCCSPAAGS